MSFTGEVHPAAAVWPMLTEDELRDLADDIARNGQQVPIVLDAEGRLLDGRNRLAACEIAGVEPVFRVHDGDPVALVLSAEKRRHQSPGQHAMGTAKILADAGQRGDGRWMRGSVPAAPDNGTSTNNAWQIAMKRAGVILDHAPDIVPLVMSGDLKLDPAYKQAEEARKTAERIAELPNDLAALVKADTLTIDAALIRVRDAERLADLPDDLATRVEESGIDLDEAEAIWRERREHIAAQATRVQDALRILARMAGNPIPEELAEHLTDRETTALPAVLAALEGHTDDLR